MTIQIGLGSPENAQQILKVIRHPGQDKLQVAIYTLTGGVSTQTYVHLDDSEAMKFAAAIVAAVDPKPMEAIAS